MQQLAEGKPGRIRRNVKYLAKEAKKGRGQGKSYSPHQIA
ncbi:hypothetical protein A2U01_0107498, partial [Trifolium medium]|nr:hypothetical protein [Trifolium medium]